MDVDLGPHIEACDGSSIGPGEPPRQAARFSRISGHTDHQAAPLCTCAQVRIESSALRSIRRTARSLTPSSAASS